MLEFIYSGYYHTTTFSTLNNEVKNSDNPKMGHFLDMRCPQCGAKIFANSVGNEWCWNCEWNNEHVNKKFKSKLIEIKKYIEILEDKLIQLQINPANLQIEMNCNQDPLDSIIEIIEEM